MRSVTQISPSLLFTILALALRGSLRSTLGTAVPAWLLFMAVITVLWSVNRKLRFSRR
jgi:hypothetical protein